MSASHPDQIIVPARLAQAMHRHEQVCAPREAAGLLAMRGQTVTDFFPVTNQDQSSSSYSISGADVLACADSAEARGERLGGVMHSHPRGSAYPSETDILEAAASDWVYVITSRGTLTAYLLGDAGVSQLTVSSSLDE